MRITDNCISCGQCAENCPVEAISEIPVTHGYAQYKIDPEKCINCGECAFNCPGDAIVVE
jgi:ferredoxin